VIVSAYPETPQPLPLPDTTWADKYGATLRPVALQFGQQVFEFTMMVGVTQHAVEIVMRRVRGNMELTRAMTIIAQNCNNFAVLLMNQGQFVDQYLACKAAIESTSPAIMVPETTGKIILPS
jgi:hypothetical protein